MRPRREGGFVKLGGVMRLGEKFKNGGRGRGGKGEEEGVFLKKSGKV